ncbi:hypothetical protein [Nocardia mangyaensis]|uniref:hypothetical protein n=1 Tax=Nocardia mangyaensis TaxID=2213200 RepID=UPI002676E8BD|nr:hypothetical protein [Nocardia mangyaensis]MDO3648666.1 hypothetical protein [Nocardia mangyaensis]
MLNTIESADLAWVWESDPAELVSALLGGHLRTITDPERAELRELALRLLLQSPAGVPTSFAELVEATAVHRLAERWGGTHDPRAVWTGARGADQIIAAVIASGVLPGLTAELTNLFHHWATTGGSAL